jgi:hypothetical protein
MRFGISQTLFALVALTASAGSALAEEAAAPAPAPVESLDTAAHDSNVSTIHGQLVPVGDKNQYTYDFKKWNVSTNPLGFIWGSYGLSLSYGISQNIALRADVNYYSYSANLGTTKDTEMTWKGFQAGIGAPIYLRRTYQGAFVEPGVVIEHGESALGTEKATTTTVFGPQMLLGWHWSWDSGFNMAVALGAGRNFSADKNADGSSNNDVFAAGYLRVGYAF